MTSTILNSTSLPSSTPSPSNAWHKVAFTALIVTSALLSGCQTSPFKRAPVVEPRYIPNIVLGEEQVLTILPGRVSCDSTRPMQCVVARQQSDAAMFQIPYDWIEGLMPAPTVQYSIRARPQIDSNKDKPTGQWTLTELISQQQISYP